MAEPDRSSPSTSSSAAAASSSSSPLYPSPSPAPERDEEQIHNHNNFDHEHHAHRFERPELDRQNVGVSHEGNFTRSDGASWTNVSDDTWSFIIVALTFWFFGNVKSPGSSVFLIIAQGNEGLRQWLFDPTFPNTTLSWNVIQGSGVIHQHIFTSSSYYVGLGNLNSEEVEVQLNLRLRAFLYNTSDAYYKCTFADGLCSLSVLFPNGNAIVLTSPKTEQDTSNDNWQVRVSYEPRWLSYVVGGMTMIMLAAFNFLNKFLCEREGGIGFQHGDVESARAPLLSHKDDDLSSWGSSYDSISTDEGNLEEFLTASSLEGKSLRDGEDSNNTRRLCAICFDAPRDCFFLPCGHCVACFKCGTSDFCPGDIRDSHGTCLNLREECNVISYSSYATLCSLQDCRGCWYLPRLSKENEEGKEDIYSVRNMKIFYSVKEHMAPLFVTTGHCWHTTHNQICVSTLFIHRCFMLMNTRRREVRDEVKSSLQVE
ncbi:E3 ubiquitin-protein ligase APD2 [Citrus sinensis]|nr:E3 ubiquitin-protein ligase APD2 [Citrus sinensis]